MFVKKANDGFFVCLKRGEKIMTCLRSFAKEHDIGGATVIGIGAIQNTKLAYYDLEKRKYIEEEFPDEAELVNLTGNLSLLNGEHFAHIHCTISDREFRAFAGHLVEAETAVVVELYVSHKGIGIERHYNEQVGLNVLSV